MPNTRTVSTLKGPRGIPRALAQPAYSLRVLRGPDKRRRKQLALGRALIGTAGAHFELRDPTVSAAHCEIVADHTGFRVRDLGSKNGVWLGEVRVREAWLGPVETLTLGETLLEFKVLDEDEERPLAQGQSFGGLFGSSVVMREVYASLAQAARSDATVLLTGESGTGKLLAAEALVQEGPRRDGPSVVVDCAALSPSLAASELLGHEKGAFTGATSASLGALRRADQGTLLLQRVNDLPPELQALLLGVLERRAVQPLGGHKAVPVDCRVVATSAVDLEREVNQGRFRADLFYRLAVVQIRLPALREHREDIPELVQHFLDELGAASALPVDVLRQLYERDYQGNVRELRNAVERAAVGVVEPEALPPMGFAVDLEVPYSQQKRVLLDHFDRAYFTRLLQSCKGNVSAAARRARMNRMYLHEVLQRLKIAGRG